MFEKKWSIKRQIRLLLAATITIILLIEATILMSNIPAKRAAVEQELETILRQVNNNVDIFFDDIESVIDNLYDSPKMQRFFIEEDPVQRYVISAYIQDIMNATIYGNMSITSLRVFQENNMVSAAGLNNQYSIFLQINRDYHFFELQPDQEEYSGIYWDETTRTPFIAYIRPVYPVTRTGSGALESDKKVIYTLCRLDRIQQNLSALTASVPGLEVYISSGGSPLLSNQTEKTDAAFQQLLQSGNHITLQRSIGRVEWEVTVGLPVTQVYAGILSSLKENLIITGLALVALWLLGLWISRKLTGPVMRLAEDIRRMEHGGKGLPAHYGLQEIDTVAFYIDGMLDRVYSANTDLMDTQNRLHQSVMSKKEAELAFYQTQINPHFLYNTLECMRSIGEAYGVEEVQVIAAAMASIFRYSIKAKDIVSLYEEIASAQDYCEIAAIRYLNKYVVRFKVDETCRSCRVPKMILQPLIENAITHGLAEKDEGGMVLVTAVRIADRLYLTVSDDGIGLSPEKLRNVQKDIAAAQVTAKTGRKGVGLSNIAQRIKLDFGEDYGLDIQSAAGFGTTVTVVLPAESG